MVEQPGGFGAEMRRRRQAAGVSLSELARRVHYSKGYLSKIELGDKPAGTDLARCCDAALDAGGTLAALAARHPARHSTISFGLESDGEVWVMGMAPDGTNAWLPMSRRAALSAGAAGIVGFTLPQGAAATTGQQSTIATFQALFEQFRQLGQRESPTVVLPMVITQTHTLRGMAATANSAQRPELLRLASRCAEFTGWMSQEAGDDRAAMWWTRTAVELAGSSGDPHLATYALVRQALITLYRDDAASTIELAKQAQSDQHAPARVRGLAALREAQGHGVAGDELNCRRALDRAADLLEATGTSDSGEAVIGPSSVANLGDLVTGWCLYDLGRPDQAAEILDRAVPRIPATGRRSQARFGARRALAHAAAGEVDQACAITHRVLDVSELVDSATIRTDLRRLIRTTARWRSHEPARDLHTRLIAALRAPVP